MLSDKLVQQLEFIAKAFEGRETIPLEAATKLLAILDKAPEEALVALIARNVKFCKQPAAFRLKDKFGWTSERVNELNGTVV